MSRYESPEYELINSDNNFELREYKSFYIIEYDNDLDPEISEGFRTLFNYISSNNDVNQKISMTIPVIEEIESNKKKMAFVLPKEFWDNAPVPNSEYLKVQQFEAGLYAVVRYGGRSNSKREDQETEALKEWIKMNNWEVSSKFMLAFYNAPFIPPIFRRNEIMVKITINNVANANSL